GGQAGNPDCLKFNDKNKLTGFRIKCGLPANVLWRGMTKNGIFEKTFFSVPISTCLKINYWKTLSQYQYKKTPILSPLLYLNINTTIHYCQDRFFCFYGGLYCFNSPHG
ncbi:MAG: hypothetical protein ABH836_06395, partial [Candidatus Omnitrophota bacterium]